jgi:hypothetical protein
MRALLGSNFGEPFLELGHDIWTNNDALVDTSNSKVDQFANLNLYGVSSSHVISRFVVCDDPWEQEDHESTTAGHDR